MKNLIILLMIAFAVTVQAQEERTYSFHPQRSVAIIELGEYYHVGLQETDCTNIMCEDVTDKLRAVWIKRDASTEPFEFVLTNLRTGEYTKIKLYPTHNKKDVYVFDKDVSVYGDEYFYNQNYDTRK